MVVAAVQNLRTASISAIASVARPSIAKSLLVSFFLSSCNLVKVFLSSCNLVFCLAFCLSNSSPFRRASSNSLVNSALRDFFSSLFLSNSFDLRRASSNSSVIALFVVRASSASSWRNLAAAISVRVDVTRRAAAAAAVASSSPVKSMTCLLLLRCCCCGCRCGC